VNNCLTLDILFYFLLVAINVKVRNRGEICKTVMDLQLLHQTINDLRNRTKQTSHQVDDKFINELKNEGIEMINSQLERKTVVVWIWCRSQSALEGIRKHYESNQLTEVICGLANSRQSKSEIIRLKVVNIDRNQFKKTVGKFLYDYKRHVCKMCILTKPS